MGWVADAFGNALGNSIVGAMQAHDEQLRTAKKLADRIGADINDPNARDVLMRAAAVQSGEDVSTDTLRQTAQDYIRLAGASDQDLAATMELYDQDLFSGIRTYPYEEAEVSGGTGLIPGSDGQVPRPVFGDGRIDDLAIGAGRIADKVSQLVDENPALKYALVGLDVAAGPAAFAVRQAIMATPVADMLQTAQAAALDNLTERFERAGYGGVDAAHGGGGSFSLGLLAVTGAAGAVKGIKASGLSNRLMYMGRTPSKASSTGLEVQARMRAEGTLIDTPDGSMFYDSRGTLRDLKDADMSHVKPAVVWWNEAGRFHGARSNEVRTWMRDSSNYRLDYYGINRAEGPTLPRYLPPEPK